jgi:maltose alpha-D-glucosyltransferase/alpha-amylase
MNRVSLTGRRVGELHAALASRSDMPDFAPEPITSDDVRDWTETLVASAETIFDRLEQERAKVDERARLLIDDLAGRRDLALARIRGLLPAEVDADKIRHHGDLHLGQILIVKDDAFIVDFEGEPNRSEAERRRKAPAARDVAGMIRSFDYAAMSALRRLINVPPEEGEKLRATLDDWKQRSSRAFYEGVREAAGHARLWPQDAEAAQRLLRFFTAEKAIYEIGYELANRPEWLSVPLAGASRAIFGREGELA